MLKIKESLLTFLALFTSISTIFCCALPIILVLLGMGVIFANLTTSFPLINSLAEQSFYLFISSFILLLISGYFVFIKAQICPVKQKLATICNKSKKINKIIWWLSSIILLISFIFKYILILFIA
jgi:mercuric ion transport protein